MTDVFLRAPGAGGEVSLFDPTVPPEQGGAEDLLDVGGIPGAEAFGVALASVALAGLSAGDDATGVGGVTLSLAFGAVGGVSGGEALGQVTTAPVVQTSGIAGVEAFGSAAVAVSFSGLSAGDDATGVGGVTLSVSLGEVGGISSAEAFGDTYAGGAYQHQPTPAAAAGGGVVYRRRNKLPAEIVHEALQLGVIQLALPAGIQSEERFGDPAVTLGLLSAAHRRKAFLKLQILSARL